MRDHRAVEPSNITLYHYKIKSYAALERKAIKAMPTIAAVIGARAIPASLT